jgi:nucleotide-binding universal stress UspA family protein
MVATDFSAHSRAAVQYAVELARELEAEVVLIHVVEPLPYRSARWGDPTKLLEYHLEVASAKLEQLERETTHLDDKCRREIHFGVVHEVIAEQASKLKIGLIIISMPVRTHLLDLLIGSIANKILRYVPTPVLRLRAGASSSCPTAGANLACQPRQ